MSGGDSQEELDIPTRPATLTIEETPSKAII